MQIFKSIETSDGEELNYSLIQVTDAYDYVNLEKTLFLLNKENQFISNKSLGENTLTAVCFLSNLSPESIGQLKDIASARYGESLKFNSSAFFKLCENLSDEIISTSFVSINNNSFNSSRLNFENFCIFTLCDSISRENNSDDITSYSLSALNNARLTSVSFIAAENTTLKSKTRYIYFAPSDFNLNSWYFLATAKFNSSDNLSACSCVSSDLDTICSILSNDSLNFSFFINSALAISDHVTQENLCSSALTSSGNVSVVVPAIYINPLFSSSSNFFSFSRCLSMPLFITSFQLTSGYFSFNSSSSLGVDIVNVAILTPPNNSVYTLKSTQIFKSFEDVNGKKLSNYSLMPVTEAYDLVNNGETLFFLDENNTPVRVKNITKQKYVGKIYDVDVPSDVNLLIYPAARRRLGYIVTCEFISRVC